MKITAIIALLLLSACAAPHEIRHHQAMRTIERNPNYEKCMDCHKRTLCNDCHTMIK